MTRSEIVAAARGFVGTPYYHQASVRGVGCDCLGLVRGVWRELLGAEPERAPAYTPFWGEAGDEVLLAAARRHFVAVDAVRPGAVLAFRWRRGRPAKHVGISTEGGQFVHAYDAVGRAVEAPFCAKWQRRLAAVFDFPGVAD